MTWEAQRTRIRRFLRDPNATIWSDSVLRRLFNIAQHNFHNRFSPNDVVEVVRTPPIFQCTFSFDWEWAFSGHARGEVWQVLKSYDPASVSISFLWEAEHFAGGGDTVIDLGEQYTQPWESWYTSLPGTVPPLRLTRSFHAIKGVWWDQQPLTPTTERELMRTDIFYRTRTGTPVSYWLPNPLENTIALYPMPTTVEWDDLSTSPQTHNYTHGYTFTWESEDAYVSGTGYKFATEDATNALEHTFAWELTYTDRTEETDTMGGVQTCPIESLIEVVPDSEFGIALFATDSSVDAGVGMVANIDGGLDATDLGATTDFIETTGRLLIIASSVPTEIVSDDDESDILRVFQKYLEYEVCEMAYGANTDGRIKSLAQYWGYRRQLAEPIFRRFKLLAKGDRDYRLTGGANVTSFVSRRYPRLPYTYPEVHP